MTTKVVFLTTPGTGTLTTWKQVSAGGWGGTYAIQDGFI